MRSSKNATARFHTSARSCSMHSKTVKMGLDDTFSLFPTARADIADMSFSRARAKAASIISSLEYLGFNGMFFLLLLMHNTCYVTAVINELYKK